MADMKLGSLLFDLILDKDGKFASALGKAKNQTESASNKMQSAIGKVGAAVTALGLLSFTKVGMDDYSKYLSALGELKRALNMTGEATSANIAHFEKLAKTIQDETNIEKTSMLAALAFAKQKYSFKMSLDDAAKAAVGLSVRLKTDLDSAFKMIARAQNNNFTLFQRMGVAFKQGATDQEKLAQVMKYAAEGYKLAEEAADSYGGKMKAFHLAIKDAGMALGKVLVPFIRTFILLGVPLIELLAKIPAAVVYGIAAISGVIYVLINYKKWVDAIKAGWILMLEAIGAVKTATGDYFAVVAGLAVAAGIASYFALKSREASASTSELIAEMGGLDSGLDKLEKGATDASKAIVNMRQAQAGIEAPTESPYKAEALQIKAIMDATREATKAEMERRRALIGTIEITDINRKAIETGLRERFNTAVTGIGDLASRNREQVNFARPGLYTRAEMNQAYTKKSQDDSQQTRLLNELVNLVKERMQPNTNELGYGRW